MYHDEKLRKQLEEAYKNMQSPEEIEEEGGGDGGSNGGVGGDGGDGNGETSTSNNDQRGLGIGGYGYYGPAGNRRWCKNGWNKDGSCSKNESYNNIDSTQELYEAWRLMEQGGISASLAVTMAKSNDAETDHDIPEDELEEGKKKKKPEVPGHSGDIRKDNKHMPRPSQTHGKFKTDKNKNRRRTDKQKGYED